MKEADELKIWNKQVLLIILAIAVVPPLLSLLTFWVTGEAGGEQEITGFKVLGEILYSFTTTTVLYTGCTLAVNFMNRVLPWKGNVAKRIVVEVLLVFSFATLAQFVILSLFHSTFMAGMDVPLDAQLYFHNIIFGNTITLIVLAIIEGVYFFRRWKESIVAAERLEKESIQSQFANLRAQLDPHFMFNSLNVLSSLIKKDPAKAEQFVENFAMVYRYVLEVKDEMVVPLSKELQFIDAYLNLQKIRFGEALKVCKNVNGTHLRQYIAPLSLQEMVNNAIKHNEVSQEFPLEIKITSNGTGILVSNNLQPRNEKIISTGLGLENLRQRYKLLSGEEPEFQVRDQEYVARIPLISEEM